MSLLKDRYVPVRRGGKVVGLELDPKRIGRNVFRVDFVPPYRDLSGEHDYVHYSGGAFVLVGIGGRPTTFVGVSRSDLEQVANMWDIPLEELLELKRIRNKIIS